MIDCESFNGTWADVKEVCDQMLADVGDGDEPNVYTTVLEAMHRLQNFDDLDVWYNRARMRKLLDDKVKSRYDFCARARHQQQALQDIGLGNSYTANNHNSRQER
jgi:hypothetical protein